MIFKRYLKDKIIKILKEKNKIIVLYGARQTGKTTLSLDIINSLNLKTIKISGDEQKYHDVLSGRDVSKLRALLEGYELAFIDEAQRIPEIGINLKIIHDNIPEIKLLVTGSSSINIASQLSESLTGRKYVFHLFPISLTELKFHYNKFEINEKIEELLIFGNYPETLGTINYTEKIQLIEEIGNSYLYKDLYELTDIRHKSIFKDLLRLLAFQIGSEVSVHGLSNTLKISRDAINNYLSLLEQSFVIFRLSGFSKNLRKEISKMDKFYFYDLGIRNMLINNYNLLNHRNDIGILWENFIITERRKKIINQQIPCSTYFWRTYTGAELDYVEEREGSLYGYEIKLTKSRFNAPKAWVNTYENSYFENINKENYLDFLL